MGGYGDVKLLREDGLRLDGRKVDEMREREQLRTERDKRKTFGLYTNEN